MGGHTNLSSSHIINSIKAPVCSCGPISKGAYEVFDNVFLMSSCISSVQTIFNKGWKDLVFQVSPLARITLCALPRGMMSEISQSITHKDCSCFKEWITKFSAHFQFWKGITVPANTDSVWGAGAKSLQQRQQCLSRTSDGCQAVETFVCLWRF